MGCDFEGTVYVPWDEIHELLKKHNPALAGGGLWHCGNFRPGDESLAVDVAYSDDNDPLTWAKPPAFLKEPSHEQ